MSKKAARTPASQAIYLQIARDLQRRILCGEWAEDGRIPPIDRLEADYPASRMTVVRAVQVLKNRGMVRTQGKRGTLIVPEAARPRIGLLHRISFASPGHAEFTHRLTEATRVALVEQGFFPIPFEEAPFPYPEDVPSASFMEALAHDALDGLIGVHNHFSQWNANHNGRITLPAVHIGIFPAPYRVFHDCNAVVETAASHLVATGRNRIGIIGNLPPQQALLRDLQKRLGFETRPEWCVIDHSQTDEAFGFRALHAIWKTAQHPDAIFISDDFIAKGVAQAALALRLNVPEELSLICMANTEIERFYPCPLERIDHSLAGLANAAVALLDRVLAGSAGTSETVLLPGGGLREAATAQTG